MTTARDLNGHDSVELLVLCFPDAAKAAHAHFFKQPEMTDDRAAGERPLVRTIIDETEIVAARATGDLSKWSIRDEFDGGVALRASHVQVTVSLHQGMDLCLVVSN